MSRYNDWDVIPSASCDDGKKLKLRDAESLQWTQLRQWNGLEGDG